MLASFCNNQMKREYTMVIYSFVSGRWINDLLRCKQSMVVKWVAKARKIEKGSKKHTVCTGFQGKRFR